MNQDQQIRLMLRTGVSRPRRRRVNWSTVGLVALVELAFIGAALLVAAGVYVLVGARL
jgi:hypothetical protein